MTSIGLHAFYGCSRLKKAVIPASVKAGTGKLTAKWKKVKGVSGYEIQYSTKKDDFTKAKTIKVKKDKTVEYRIKNLKSKKTYYVRIRAWQTVSKKNYYSSWSKAVKVTVK